MRKYLASFKEHHPIVNMLLIGTVFARTASSMSLPFLAIYLLATTNMSPVTIGAIIGIGSLAGMAGGFVGGFLSDRFGRRVVMLSSLYVWAIVFLGFSLTKNPLVFALLNATNGLCRSFFEPVSQALMADLTEREKRLHIFSLRYLAINIGVAVGPLLGTLFAAVNGSLPWMITGFFYLVYATTLHVLLIKFGIRSIEGEKKEHVTISQSWQVIARDRAFRFFILGGIVSGIGYAQMTSTLSQYVEGQFATGATLFAWLMTANAVVVVAFQMPLSKWAGKYSPLTAIAVGSVCYALGHLGFAFSQSWTMFIVSMVFFTWGEVLTFPAGAIMVDRLAPDHMRGTYFGAQSFTSLGFFLGPLLGGFLLQKFGGSTLFVTVAIITLISVLFYRIGMQGGTAQIQKQAGQAGGKAT
ncbi:MDR family MFS transporter [Paenibacillus sp. CAU 1782]